MQEKKRVNKYETLTSFWIMRAIKWLYELCALK